MMPRLSTRFRTPFRREPRTGRVLALLLALLLLPAAALAADDDPDPVPVLGEINIEGNARTDEQLILREMGLVPGQPFTYDDMDAVWDHLEDVGYFAFVDMEYDDSDPEHVVLNVILEEDLTFTYGPLVRYDRRHKYLLGGRLEERNFRGKGEIIEAGLSVYYIQRAELSWTKPWFLGADGLELGVTGVAEQANFVFRPTDYRKWDAGLGLRWNFAGPFFVRAGADYGQFNQREDFTWPVYQDGAPVPGANVLNPAGISSHWVLRGAVGLDSRDNPWYPRQGLCLDFSAGRWLSDEFADYDEAVGDARVFVPLPIKKHVLALRGWGRRTSGPSQLDNALYLGGPGSIRGVQFGSIEGDEGYLLSVEYRAPLFLMPISPRGELIGAGLHAFADAGDAWYHGADPQRAAQSWGGGVHLNLDTWQLRFEAAKSRDGDWVFEFMDRFNF